MTEKNDICRGILRLLAQIRKPTFNMMQMSVTHQYAAALTVKNAFIRRGAKRVTVAGHTAEG